jgi:predicted DCC family thiol-disulfide oxidoreductase YuxK
MTTTEPATDPSATDAPPGPLAAEELREHPIVFYDGVCGLCNATVDGLIRRDRKGVLRFAPLQGETAERALPEADRESLGSLLLLTDEGLYRRSAAVVRILKAVGGSSSALGTLLWLVPLPFRDLGYRIVARSRYNWFGKKESCRMPTPGERDRLLP